MNEKQATLFSINFIQTKLHMTNYHLELRGTWKNCCFKMIP